MCGWAQPFPPRGTSGTSGTALPQVGDWVHGLCAAGENEAPLQIQTIETGPDGQPYALFVGGGSGSLLERCERVPPAAAPRDGQDDTALIDELF